MKHHVFLKAALLALTAISFLCFSHSLANYSYVIGLDETTVDGSEIGAKPGDVIGIEAGERKHLQLSNFTGTEKAPITFINNGGKVQIGNSERDGIVVLGGSHFIIRGDGDPNYKYGIHVFKAKGQCMELEGKSTNYEVCFIELSGASFAGIMSKTDPSCDKSNNRGAFTQYDISLHDLYVHDVGGEGMYVGHSFYSGLPDSRSGCGTLYPHDIIGVQIYDNIVERTGYDGIQVGSASQNCEIYRNRIQDVGLRGILPHRNGIQIGEGTTGKCFANTILNAPSNGIVMLGLGNNDIFNNIIANTGTNSIFCDSRPDTIDNNYTRIYNNTFVNPAKHGILKYNTYGQPTASEFRNNILVVPNDAVKPIEFGPGATGAVESNVAVQSSAALRFVNESNDDFRLMEGSIAIDAGQDLSDLYGLQSDIQGTPRPHGQAFDAGAYEAGGLSVSLYVNHPTVDGANDGSITASVIGGQAPYSYLWSNGSTTVQLMELGTGTYSVTVTDQKGAMFESSALLREPEKRNRRD